MRGIPRPLNLALLKAETEATVAVGDVAGHANRGLPRGGHCERCGHCRCLIIRQGRAHPHGGAGGAGELHDRWSTVKSNHQGTGNTVDSGDVRVLERRAMW